MSDIPLKDIIDVSLSKIGKVADVNTVIGEPINLADGITVIPFSKVSVGFASGGADYDGKAAKEPSNVHFAGGNGAGVSVTPMGFIILNKGDVKVIDLKHPVTSPSNSNDPVNKAIDAISGIVDRGPELILKIKELLDKKKDDKDKDADSSESTEPTGGEQKK